MDNNGWWMGMGDNFMSGYPDFHAVQTKIPPAPAKQNTKRNNSSFGIRTLSMQVPAGKTTDLLVVVAGYSVKMTTCSLLNFIQGHRDCHRLHRQHHQQQ